MHTQHQLHCVHAQEIIARSLVQEQHPSSAARAAVATAPSIQPATFAASFEAHDTPSAAGRPAEGGGSKLCGSDGGGSGGSRRGGSTTTPAAAGDGEVAGDGGKRG